MRRPHPIAVLAMAGWLAAGVWAGPARGQTLANPVINEFEIAPAGSLEGDILERLAEMHRYDPRDLFRLARMTVLESIAMYENLRADLPATMIGARREGEMSTLWDAAELFYVSVTPSDAASLVRSRPLLADVEAAYGRLEATLGAMPGLSPRAALHLQNVARMLPVMNALIDAMEAEQGIPAGSGAPAARPVATAGVDGLREQVRGLVEGLRGLGQSLREVKSPPEWRDAVLADLDRLIDLVQGLDRMLADGAPAGDIVETLRLIRSRLWPIQARFLQMARTPGLAGRWRPVRDRLNGLSDQFDRPRVIAPRPAAANRPAAGVDRRLLARSDRAITALDEFVGRAEIMRPEAAGGLQYREDLGLLRRQLLVFRERVAAGESAGVLSRSFREIDDLNRRLGERVRAESRIFRGGARLDARGFEAAADAVARLRELVPTTAP